MNMYLEMQNVSYSLIRASVYLRGFLPRSLHHVKAAMLRQVLQMQDSADTIVYIDMDAFVSNMDQNLVCLLEYWGGWWPPPGQK